MCIVCSRDELAIATVNIMHGIPTGSNYNIKHDIVYLLLKKQSLLITKAGNFFEGPSFHGFAVD